MGQGHQKIESIQALRGVAALLVVFYHFWQLAGQHTATRALFLDTGIGTVGAAGVDLFFIISGFVMVIAVADRGARPADFLLRRALRIYPLYWVWTTVLLVMVLLGYFVPEEPSGLYLVASYLLIPYAHPGQPVNHVPLLGQGWTLSYEIYFYLIFALCLVRFKRFHVIRTTLVLALVYAVALAVQAPASIRYVASSPLVLEFAAGMGAARLYQWLSSRWPQPRSKALPLTLLLVGCILALGAANSDPDLWTDRFIAFGVPCLAVVVATIMLELSSVRPTRLLCYLGDASYSIYLSHGIMVVAIAYWLSHRAQPLSHPDLFITLTSVAATLLGIASFESLERPLLRFFEVMRSRTTSEDRLNIA